MARRTQVYDFHREHGHMTEYANFDMPVWFKGAIPEALAVRNAVGIFDVSHMGRLLISGEEAAAFLNMVTTRDASPLDIGQGAYGFLCNEQGASTLLHGLQRSQQGEGPPLASGKLHRLQGEVGSHIRPRGPHRSARSQGPSHASKNLRTRPCNLKTVLVPMGHLGWP